MFNRKKSETSPKEVSRVAQEVALLEALMDNTTDHIYFKDIQSRFLMIGSAQATRFGLNDPADAIGKTDFDFFTAEHAQAAFNDEQKILKTGLPIVDLEEKETWPDGSETWVSTTKLCRLDAAGQVIGTVGISRDITKRKLAEEALRSATDRLNLATRAGGVGIWDFDVKQNNLDWDDQMFHLYGLSRAPSSQAHKIRLDALRPEDRLRVAEELNLALMGKKDYDTEYQVVWPDGTIHDIRVLAVVRRDEIGRPLHMIGTSWDITVQKQASRVLEHEAMHDPLTGLLNRRAFAEDLTRELSRARRYRHGLALGVFDVDHFKLVNDTYGHAVGDEVLCEIVARVGQSLRGHDVLARSGGDEFSIITEQTSKNEAMAIYERVRAAVAETPLSTSGGEIFVTISLGVKLCGMLETQKELFEEADVAMYQAKRAGGNLVCFAESSILELETASDDDRLSA
jgi:diguanylate cyclase (GGDEF)-like protein/PAS domain S-box-containing protein